MVSFHPLRILAVGPLPNGRIAWLINVGDPKPLTKWGPQSSSRHPPVILERENRCEFGTPSCRASRGILGVHSHWSSPGVCMSRDINQRCILSHHHILMGGERKIQCLSKTVVVRRSFDLHTSHCQNHINLVGNSTGMKDCQARKLQMVSAGICMVPSK